MTLCLSHAPTISGFMILRVLSPSMVSVEKPKVPMYLYICISMFARFPGGWTELPLYDTDPLHQVFRCSTNVLSLL